MANEYQSMVFTNGRGITCKWEFKYDLCDKESKQILHDFETKTQFSGNKG